MGTLDRDHCGKFSTVKLPDGSYKRFLLDRDSHFLTVSSMVTGLPPIPDLPFDPGLLELAEEEADFFRVLTGIKDDEELKQHIVDVSAKAYKVSGSLAHQNWAMS
jgi:hypothetical protein